MDGITCTKGRGKLELLPLSTFCYFKADSKYIVGYDDGGQEYLMGHLTTLKTLKDAHPELVATHRSYLAARPITAVEKAWGGGLFAKGDNFQIPISRRYAPAIRALARQN